MRDIFENMPRWGWLITWALLGLIALTLIAAAGTADASAGCC